MGFTPPFENAVLGKIKKGTAVKVVGGEIPVQLAEDAFAWFHKSNKELLISVSTDPEQDDETPRTA
jgi:hypothetical protein